MGRKVTRGSVAGKALVSQPPRAPGGPRVVTQDHQALSGSSNSLPSAGFHHCSTGEPCTAIAACATPTALLVLVAEVGPGCRRGDTRALTGAGAGAWPPCCPGSTRGGQLILTRPSDTTGILQILHLPLLHATPNQLAARPSAPLTSRSSQPLSLLKGRMILFFPSGKFEREATGR